MPLKHSFGGTCLAGIMKKIAYVYKVTDDALLIVQAAVIITNLTLGHSRHSVSAVY